MILTKCNPTTGTTEIVARGTAKDFIDYLSKLADNNESVKPDCVLEKDGTVHGDYMQYDTLIAGINADQITGFRIDSGLDYGLYSILDPDAPVTPLFSKKETIKSLKGDKYDEYAKKIQERFTSLMNDAKCLGLNLAYLLPDCDGVHLVAIPANIELTEKKPAIIHSIETIDLVKELPYIDNGKVITLYTGDMGEGGCNRYCHRK